MINSNKLRNILRRIYIQDNKHWLPNGKAERHINEGTAIFTERNILKAMREVYEIGKNDGKFNI